MDWELLTLASHYSSVGQFPSVGYRKILRNLLQAFFEVYDLIALFQVPLLKLLSAFSVVTIFPAISLLGHPEGV
jgi:hypothetical protein